MISQEICDIFLHENSVLCISVHPKQSYVFATACESGQISLYDLRCSASDPIILASTSLSSRSYFSSDSSSSNSPSSFRSPPSIQYMGGAFNSCHFNPVDSNFIAIANEITGISLIDIRMNRVLLRYRSGISTGATCSESERRSPFDYNQNVMSVRFNKIGTQLVALRAKMRPVIYELNNSSPVFLFDDESYSNSCTLKSCCFAGDSDQYLVSGSDDFNVYLWKIPSLSYNFDNKTNLVSQSHLCLKGHRSIVNQCRYNSKYHMLASSGVEKLIKVWCPYKIPGNHSGGLLGLPVEYVPPRRLYTFNDLFSFRWSTIDAPTTQNSNTTALDPNDPNDTLIMSYQPVIRNRSALPNSESTEEDRIMIAFFDSQVRRQRKIEETINKSLFNNKKKKRRSQTGAAAAAAEEDDLSVVFSNDEEDESNSDNENENESDKSTSTTSDSDDSSNKEAKQSRIITSPETSSSDDETDEDEDEDNDDDDGFDVNKLKRKLEPNSAKSSKRKLIPLRDRLRNLRYRQSLNLTQESDYINVLDSLNVTNKEDSNNSSDINSNETRSNLGATSSIEILSETNPSEICSFLSTMVTLPSCSKQSETKTMVKTLNEHKRKIELDEDEDLVNTKKESSEETNETVTFKKKNKKRNDFKKDL